MRTFYGFRYLTTAKKFFRKWIREFFLCTVHFSFLTWQQKREREYTQPACACEIPQYFCLIEEFFRLCRKSLKNADRHYKTVPSKKTFKRYSEEEFTKKGSFFIQ